MNVLENRAIASARVTRMMAVLALVLLNGQASAEPVSYVSLTRGWVASIDPAARLLDLGESVSKFPECEQSRSFRCIRVDNFIRLAVPVDLSKFGDRWTVDGIEYSVSQGLGPGEILGKPISYCVIAAEVPLVDGSVSKREMLWSPEIGLFAQIVKSKDGEVDVMFLMSRKGLLTAE